jgi:hypothetical protein
MSSLENTQKTEFLFHGMTNDKYKFSYAVIRLICKTIVIMTAILRIDISFIPDLMGKFF